MMLDYDTYFDIPCEFAIFKINGINAEANDFGWATTDKLVSTDDQWGCRNHIWHSYTDPVGKETACRKYGLTDEEYAEVCETLEDILTFDCCDCCNFGEIK